MIFYDSSVVILPLGFQLSCGKSVRYRFVEFFAFDSDSLPYLLCLCFWSGVTFPLVALDKMCMSVSGILLQYVYVFL